MKLRRDHENGRIVSAILTGCVLLSGWAGRQAWGQTNTAKAADSGNRYLLIVETSREMERRSQGLLQTVQRVLGSTLGKEIAKGDTLGTWTYNQALHSGRFPLQRWSPVGKDHTIAAISRFLAGEKYESKPHFEKVMPALATVVANSPMLTVVLITSGAENIRGTPFDEKINATFSHWQEEQQKNRSPFVVLFRAEHGKMTACAVTPAPWPLEVPPLPEFAKASAAQTNSASSAAKAAEPARAVPPLIITGKKPRPVETNVVSTAAPAKAEVPKVPPSEAKPTLTEGHETNAPMVTRMTGPATTPQASGQPAAPAVTALAPPKPETATNSNPPTLASMTTVDEKPAVDHPPAALATTKNPATNAGMPAGKEAKVVVLADNTNPPPVAETPSSAENAPAVAAIPSQVHATRDLAFLLGAVSFLVAVVGCVWRSRNRTRAHRPISLITRSLERHE